MRNEVEKSKDLNFFQWEKALRNNPSSKLEIGNYLGEIDESGRPKFGILRVENVEFLPNGIFVGEFGDDGLPHDGELRTPGFVVKLKSLEDGTRFLSQRSLEGGKVQEFQYRDGSWKTLKTIAINGDLLNEKDEIIKKFNEEEISARSITLPSIEEVDKKFLPVKQAFSKLKMVHQDKYLKYQEKLHNEGDIETSEKLQKFKDRLASKEILRSETMFAELTGIKNEDDQQRYAIIERGVGIRRKIEKPKEDEIEIFKSEIEKFGNCREYGSQTQKIAIDSGLQHTFILFGSPDHVFNVAIENDKIIAIDGWNGDLIYDFSPREFYKNQSLHAIFDLKIHKDTWLGPDNPNGIARPLEKDFAKSEDLLVAKIKEINEARFDPEITEIMQKRVEEKIKKLDPNDEYYHQNAIELKHIINHFGLTTKLIDKMRNEYIEKFNPDKLIVGNEAYVIYDLFCRDEENSKEKFTNFKREFLSKISPKIDFENGRVKALFNGFAKVLEMEFGEKLDQKITKKLSPNPEKISIEKLIAKTTKGANEI